MKKKKNYSGIFGKKKKSNRFYDDDDVDDNIYGGVHGGVASLAAKRLVEHLLKTRRWRFNVLDQGSPFNTTEPWGSNFLEERNSFKWHVLFIFVFWLNESEFGVYKNRLKVN